MALPGAWRRGLAAERGPQAAVPAADTGLGGARRPHASRRPPPAPASTGRNLDRTSLEQDRETDESAQPKTQKTSHAGQRSRPCVSPFPRWLRVWGGRAAGTQGAAPWSWVCTTPGCPAGDGPSLPAATASRPQPLGRCPGLRFTPWRHRGLGGPGLTRGKQTVTLHLAEVARGVGEWQVQGPRGAGVSDMERKNER